MFFCTIVATIATGLAISGATKAAAAPSAGKRSVETDLDFSGVELSDWWWHHPGWGWDGNDDAGKSQGLEGARSIPGIHLLTYVDQFHPGLCALAASANDFGFRPLVLGLESFKTRKKIRETFYSEERRGQVFHKKIRVLADGLASSLKSGHFGAKDWVLVVDAFDVFVQQNASLVMSLLERMELEQGRPAKGQEPPPLVVFMGEEICFPWSNREFTRGLPPILDFDGVEIPVGSICQQLLDRTGPSALPFPFLNSGIMGRASAVHQILSRTIRFMDKSGMEDDQAALALALLASNTVDNSATVTVDSAAMVSHVASRTYANHFDRELCDPEGHVHAGGSPPRLRTTGAAPPLLHISAYQLKNIPPYEGAEPCCLWSRCYRFFVHRRRRRDKPLVALAGAEHQQVDLSKICDFSGSKAVVRSALDFSLSREQAKAARQIREKLNGRKINGSTVETKEEL